MEINHIKRDITIVFGVALILAFILCSLVLATVAYLAFGKRKPIYLISTGHICMDLILISAFLFYLIPIAYASAYIFPGGRFGVFGQLATFAVEWSWLTVGIFNILMAINRFIVVCFPYVDFFTFRNTGIIVILIIITGTTLALFAQFFLPCCPIMLNHHLMAYNYIVIEGVTNYSNYIINTPINIGSSLCAVICYAGIFYNLAKSSKTISLVQGQRRKHKRELLFALQFFAVSLFHLIEWTSFRILPYFVNLSAKEFDPYFLIVGFSLTINATMNSVVYMIFNQEVRSILIRSIVPVKGSRVHATTLNVSSMRSGD